MQTAIQQEYKVLMMRSPTAKVKGGHHWRATLLGFPNIVEEAFSRDEAIKQIEARLADLLTDAEIITVHALTQTIAANDSTDELATQGWDDYGIFKDDPAALQIFEEIEQERARNLVGGA